MSAPTNTVFERRVRGPERSRAAARTWTLTVHALLLVGSLIMVGPFVWMILTSVKTFDQVLNFPMNLIPTSVTLNNYWEAINSVSFPRAFWNSVYITVLNTTLIIVTSAMAAYAFARIDFKGSRVLFVIFLASMMFPLQVTLIPTFYLLSSLNWIDTHLALIIPGSLSSPFAVFLIRQFIRALPIELEDAALIDGAGRWRTFFLIVLPNIRSGLAALAIVTAIGSWNGFFFPLVVLNSPELFTVPLLLSQFNGQFGGLNYAVVMAASTLSIAPMLIMFVIAHRWIINAMAMSGFGGR